MRKWKINLIFLLFFVASAFVVNRLSFLQISQGKFYKAFSQGLHAYSQNTLSGRGEIFLENEKPLAINVEHSIVFENSGVIKDLSEAISALSNILNIEENVLFEKINNNLLYAVLKENLSKEEINQINELDIYGVFVNTENKRYYPQEQFLSSIIGFLGAENKGQYGLEEYYEETLRTKDGIIHDKKGSDLFLTIDYNIQFEAETLLKRVKENLDIKGGEIIVIEPSSGKILAMASLSNFDPNYYGEYADRENLAIFKNKATQELFEPGSVFKPITMASAIEEKRITPETTYEDPGCLQIDIYPVCNYEQRVYEGDLTMTNVLEKSINTGAVFAQKELGGDLFIEYIEKFGFLEKTKIDTQEVFSSNKNVRSQREVSLATAAFGQGIEITPIQLIRAYCAIANGGRLVTPHLVEKIVDSDNQTFYPYQENIENARQVISAKTSSQVVSMLVSVVENGFGKAAQVPGYFIAGKTGTSQVSYGSLGINKAGYSDETIQSFIGFAPAFNPRFLMLVRLDNPKTKTAEYSAIPAFQELAEYIIRLYQIPLDYEQ